MQFSNNNYYSAMDHIDNAAFFASEEPADLDEEGNPITPDEALNFTPQTLGMSTKPGVSPLQALQADIKQGTGKVEFTFMGQGKGNAQSPTPESVSAQERQDMRELLKINKVRASTHAAVHEQSLAGFGKGGFNSESRAHVLKEINKAIHFAGEATTGGAVVFHMHEWQRPLSELNGKGSAKFQSYPEEDNEAVLFSVDKRTGDAISTISKNREIFRPRYVTAGSEGKAGTVDNKGNLLKEDDWIDVRGNLIPKDASTEDLFNRVPVFNKEKTKFEVDKLTWEKLVEETNRWNEIHPEQQREPEEMFAIIEIENKVLQAKGSSLFHGHRYESLKYERDDLLKDLELYEKLKDQVPEDERWKLDSQFTGKFRGGPRSNESTEDFLKRTVKDHEDQMRHIHESSASADVQAVQAQEMIKNVESAKKYGLKKTSETIAKVGLKAMETYNKNKDKYGLTDPIYAAPENYHQGFFGSHPKEMREIVESSRKEMARNLMKKGKSKQEAEDLSKTHIKATIDIGHLNTLRYNFVAKDEDNFEKEFKEWLLKETESLVKDGIVGNIHLSDNFGYDDEHLTPGQGNIPMKEFMKMIEKHKVKDVILERGSYNEHTGYLDTFAHVNAPVFGRGMRQRFAPMRNAHFGQNAPGFFIAGAYSPSNDWRPWTEIPLE